ncbi:DUF2867 domain-containing protein [Actinokineospora iranica]|uniref:DUF2867 domain-containing protein n=1 Tax=Actinokineospora iranica TaxID=1271860 RepID=UPI001E6219CB|nr:DUF2867 domain-containing protein [Actinokineospora iranica]
MPTCLVLGAGGYIGTRLVAALRADGHQVRAMGRSLPAVPDGVRGIRADIRDADALAAATSGVDVVYHLVHSLAGKDFVRVDERIAHAVAAAAAAAGVRQIVYLGGPRPRAADLSDHLASRAEVGDVFLEGPTPALVLRASMIIGRGSASFELLGWAARAPVVLRPSWMANRSRPVAVGDVLHHLRAAASREDRVNGAVDVAGPDTMTYLDLLQRYARIAGLPWRLPLPVAALPGGPALVAAVGPLPAPLTRALLESMRHDLVPDPATVLPPPPGGATSVDRALRAAVGGDTEPARPPARAPGLVRDRRVLRVRATAATLWRVIADIGGDRGWHTIPGVWALRGALDHLVGGIGLHKGRPARLSPGDVVDSWTVVDRGDAERVLVLRADMRLPGRAWLALRAVDNGRPGECDYEQTVTFVPDGLPGRLYWLAQKPAHDIVFGLMARNIARTAEA